MYRVRAVKIKLFQRKERYSMDSYDGLHLIQVKMNHQISTSDGHDLYYSTVVPVQHYAECMNAEKDKKRPRSVRTMHCCRFRIHTIVNRVYAAQNVEVSTQWRWRAVAGWRPG